MPTCDDIRNRSRRVELLAPAGKWDALEAVLAAGADAVYLSAKRFNMRQHRSDFHFTERQLIGAVALTHQMGRRLYVTVNVVVGEAELDDLRELLVWLDGIGVDAVIVADLATVQLAGELALKVPLHASTMMNVHTCESAGALKSLGVTRIIASRDISIEAIGDIGSRADVEVECFAHGDMCVAQSGQCSLSGATMGKSANRGACMKPCRWAYDLVRLGDGEVLGAVQQGHLLSIKDLCLIRRIPDVIQAGICSLKIEGRMRDASYLGSLVACYAQTIDAYYNCPGTFRPNAETVERLHRNRVRDLSELTVLGSSSRADHFDASGAREPVLLSNGHREVRVSTRVDLVRAVEERRSHRVELAVSVADVASARAAIQAGADRVYLAAEVSRRLAFCWSGDSAARIIHEAHDHGVTVGLRTPRVTTRREWAQTESMLRGLMDHDLDYVLVHHLGTLRLAKKIRGSCSIIADYGFNLLNSAAVELLARLGVDQMTVSNEAGYVDLALLARGCGRGSRRPAHRLEILAHGPVTGMLMDHCVIARYATPTGRKDDCSQPCARASFGLRDALGEVRPVIADQHCRNHLLTACDLAILPKIEEFLFPAVRSIRIEGQFYEAELIEAVTRAYRLRLDDGASEPRASARAESTRALGPGSQTSARAEARGSPTSAQESAWKDVVDSSPRPLNLGPYARSMVNARSTATVMKEPALR